MDNKGTPSGMLPLVSCQHAVKLPISPANLLQIGPVPPYEANPSYGTPPPIQQNNASAVVVHAIHCATLLCLPEPYFFLSMQKSFQPADKRKLYSSYPQPIQQYPQQQPQPYQSPMASPPVDPQKQEYYPQQQQQPVQHQPTMPVQQASGYQTAVPLQNLQEAAAPVDCPSCRTRALTRTEFHSGNTT
ncbi:MAG: hypothetical protein Q9214_003493, partial [Letrouitia sp. 1 TL-2023]